MKNLTTTYLFLSVLICSCTRYYYVPNVQNVPLFREKNEYRLSGTFGGGDESACIEVQAAYSVTDKIGIMTNFMSAKGGDISNNKNWAEGIYLDGAIGYFKPIKKYSVFEVYGGFGGGNQHHNYMNANYNNGTISNSSGGTSDLSFTKIFIQPSFGLTFKGFDVAVSTRICRLSFNNIINQISIYSDEYSTLNSITSKNYFFLEPAITIRGGWKYVKLQFQAATASYFNNPDSHFEDYHFGIGVYFAFAERYRKDIPKK